MIHVVTRYCGYSGLLLTQEEPLFTLFTLCFGYTSIVVCVCVALHWSDQEGSIEGDGGELSADCYVPCGTKTQR